MNNVDNILEWVEQSPEINRKRLCKKFEDDNEFAYDFAIEHPVYQGFVKHFIAKSKYAYLWARDIGHQEFMKSKITDSHIAYLWARDIGHQEFMKSKIKRSLDALWWTIEIGHKEFMKQIIEENGDTNWIRHWNKNLKNN